MLIVETGEGRPDAESYCSLDFANIYLARRGLTLWRNSMDDDQREAALRRATDYMLEKFRSGWRGNRTMQFQRLDWPRSGAFVDGFEIAANEIPLGIQEACAALAFKAAAGDLAPDAQATQSGIKSKQVGDIKIEYSEGSTPINESYRSIEMMVAPYLQRASGSIGSILIQRA